MDFDILDPNSTLTAGLQGLAVCCFNKEFNNNEGRWEVAIPRFSDHSLTIEIEGIGVLAASQSIKEIVIRSQQPANPPKEPKYIAGDPAVFDRTKPQENDKNDFRWITDYTNEAEIPQGDVSVITTQEQPDRVAVTMLYVHDSTFYTKRIVPTGSGTLIRTDLNLTAPVVNGRATALLTIEAKDLLDNTPSFGFSASTVGMDVGSHESGPVEISFDGDIAAIITPNGSPAQMLIVNREPAQASTIGRFIETDKFRYGLGDFSRYYSLFNVSEQKFHLWEKHLKDKQPFDGITGDCNPVRASLKNLNGLSS